MYTTYFRNLIAGNVFRTKTDPGLPSLYYYGISSTAPNESGENVTEPVGGGYARIRLNNLSEPTNGQVVNTSALPFNESTVSWGGPYTHFVIYDAPVRGNLLIYGELENPQTIDAENLMVVKTATLRLAFTNPDE